ncbi:MAG TPA: hypothetical protein EYP17_08895 [Candidatus Latescibacteria bacterium]|nr:hypothetical protein [Candidatus Latescibacterota bacterium]
MKEERLRVLKMLEEGKISVEEAAKLLEALEAPQEEPSAEGKAKWLRVRVAGADEQVNVNLPLSLAKLALRFIPKEAKVKMEERGVDLEQILGELSQVKIGKLVEVRDGEDLIEVWID